MVLNLGIGYGVFTILLFTSLKLDKNLTGLFFFGIMNVGAAHSNSSCFSALLILLAFPLLSLASDYEFVELERPGHEMVLSLF